MSVGRTFQVEVVTVRTNILKLKYAWDFWCNKASVNKEWEKSEGGWEMNWKKCRGWDTDQAETLAFTLNQAETLAFTLNKRGSNWKILGRGIIWSNLFNKITLVDILKTDCKDRKGETMRWTRKLLQWFR